MKIERFFTRNLSSPYEGITFEARKSEIKTMDGSLVSKVKKMGEDQKVAIRNARRDGNKHADALKAARALQRKIVRFGTA